MYKKNINFYFKIICEFCVGRAFMLFELSLQEVKELDRVPITINCHPFCAKERCRQC